MGEGSDQRSGEAQEAAGKQEAELEGLEQEGVGRLVRMGHRLLGGSQLWTVSRSVWTYKHSLVSLEKKIMLLFYLFHEIL